MFFSEFLHSRSRNDETLALNRTIRIPENLKNFLDERNKTFDYRLNRDSGTSSPQPNDSKTNLFQIETRKTKISVNVVEMINSTNDDDGNESDSNDSVFSSGSSDDLNGLESSGCFEIRDIYLGGSCMLRTRWRQELAIPILKTKGISYYLPSLHESLENKNYQQNIKNNSTTTKTTHSLEKRIKINAETTTATLSSLSSSGGSKNNSENENSKINNLNDIDNNHDILNDKSEKLDIIKLNSKNLEFPFQFGKSMFNPALLDSSRVLLFIITNETRSLAPMTLAAHYIGLGYNVVLCVQMLPEFCIIGNDTVSIFLPCINLIICLNVCSIFFFFLYYF